MPGFGEESTLTLETQLVLKDLMSKPLARAGHAASAEMHGAFERIHGQAEGIGERFKEVLGGVGVAFSTWKLAEKFVELNSEAENATRQMGGTLAAMYRFAKDPTENMRSGLERAREVMEGFNKAGFEGGFASDKLAAAGMSIARGWSAARRGTADMVPFVTQLAKVARMRGLNVSEAASSVSMAIERGMAGRNSPMMQLLGIAPKQLRSLRTEASRLKLIETRLAMFSPAGLESMETFSDRVEKIKTRISAIMEDAGKPFFEQAKTAAGELADHLKESREELTVAAGLVGTQLARGIGAASGGVKLLADHLGLVITALEGFATYKLVGKLGLGALSSSVAGMTLGRAGFATAAGEAIGLGAVASMLGQAALIGGAIGMAANAALDWAGLGEIIRDDADRQAKDMRRTEMEGFSATVLSRAAMAGKLKAGETWEARKTWALGQLIGEAEKAKGGKVGLFSGGAMVGAAGAEELRSMAGEYGIKAPAERTAPYNDFRNSTFNIKQDFAPGFDPDRIAVAFANDLAQLGEMASQSSFSPLYSVR